jgi:hypothetical protein
VTGETVVGVFDDERAAQKAKEALLRAGVPEENIMLSASPSYTLSVATESTFVREQVRDVMRRNGARTARC